MDLGGLINLIHLIYLLDKPDHNCFKQDMIQYHTRIVQSSISPHFARLLPLFHDQILISCFPISKPSCTSPQYPDPITAIISVSISGDCSCVQSSITDERMRKNKEKRKGKLRPPDSILRQTLHHFWSPLAPF